MLSVSFLRQIIQLLHRVQILREARRLEFRIGQAEIAAGEFRVQPHRAGHTPN
jgi:hypothetical protein